MSGAVADKCVSGAKDDAEPGALVESVGANDLFVTGADRRLDLAVYSVWSCPPALAAINVSSWFMQARSERVAFGGAWLRTCFCQRREEGPPGGVAPVDGLARWRR